MRLPLVVLGLSLACSSTPAAQVTGPLDVTTDKGVVRGSSDGTVRAFLGIPFAAPPTGSLRFMPPTPAKAWSTPLVANTFGPQCAQFGGGGTMLATSSEDCLYLNVWVPDAAVTKAPVFVWIHGGGFILGSGSDTLYSGENLAAQSNAIVVTVNYRLGPFGFLSHPALATAENVTTSPSQGLLDQQAALAWVKANIAAFGGDPANVTVAGESAGGVSVCTHLAMPGSKGLFQRAVIESGLCSTLPALFQTPASASDQGNRMATALGCTDAATALTCMQGKLTTEVLSALPLRHALFGATGDSYGPVIDGVTLPQSPLAAIKAGAVNKVPTIVGSNLNEGQLFLSLWGTPAPTTSDLDAMLSLLFTPTQVTAISGKYPVATDAPTAFTNILGDVINCMARQTARALAGAGVPTWLYRFVYPFQLAALPGVVTSHSYELPFVFRNGFEGTQLSDADLAVADAVDGYWLSFAKTGVPAGAPTWPAYTAQGDEDLDIGAPPSVVTGLKASTCDFWDTVMPE